MTELADTDPADLCGVHVLPEGNRKPVVDHVLEARAHLGAALRMAMPEDRTNLAIRLILEHVEDAARELDAEMEGRVR